MRKIVSIACVIVLTFMFSACATYTSVKETDAFLAAEKAKGIKPKTIAYVKSMPSKTTASSSLAMAGSAGSLWQVADIAGGSVLAAPVIVGGVVLTGLSAAAGGAEKAATPEDAMLRYAVARTDYGRFVEYQRSKAYKKSDVKNDQPSVNIFVEALREAGDPPAPCVIIRKKLDYTNDYGSAGHRFKRDFKWCIDKTSNTFIGFAKVLKYTLVYKTDLPEKEVPGQAPAICTEEMAGEHFSKVVKIMENH